MDLSNLENAKASPMALYDGSSPINHKLWKGSMVAGGVSTQRYGNIYIHTKDCKYASYIF